MKTFIIAEAGVNHNGSIDLAKGLIDAAADAGADVVKFQTFKAEKLVVPGAPKAGYQKQTSDTEESQFQMLKRLELSDADHLTLVEHCTQRGIAFLSTPFDLASLVFLVNRVGLKTIKISSGDMLNAPLLLEAARCGVKVILSTGMSDMAEIRQALSVLAFGYVGAAGGRPCRDSFVQAWHSAQGQAALTENVTLLHCTTEYPAPIESVNLRAMDSMVAEFGLKVGFSDHTMGIIIPLAAVARGARVIEKHFTLDRTLPGPDHNASLLPQELAAMVTGIRQIEAAMGNGVKQPADCEQINRPIVRKSLVAAQPIRRGEIFTVDNLAIKRPGGGASPLDYYDRLGQVAEHDYGQDEALPCTF